MTQQEILDLLYDLIRHSSGHESLNTSIRRMVHRLYQGEQAQCVLFLKREEDDLSPGLTLAAYEGECEYEAYLGEPLGLPREFDCLDGGAAVLRGPQAGTVLINECYTSGLLLPLGEMGCVLLLGHEPLPEFDYDQAHAALDALGQLLMLLQRNEIGVHGDIHAARQENAAKSEFLTRMSHELRTPLNAILGFTQLFEFDDNLTQIQLDNIKEIERAGYLMLQMVNEVLDLAKIESGRIEITMEEVGLGDVLNECLSLISTQAAQRNITIQVGEMCDQLHLSSDPVRLKQILINLLSNAIKYNVENGTIEVFCDITNDQCQISVKDSGLGIPSEKLPGLFQPFNRLCKEHVEIEGTGMGLVISRKLAELMGGEIGVESTLGQGSTFWFTQAVIEGAATDVKITQSTEVQVPPTIRRILVVEDNPVNQDLLCRQLAILGYESDVVANGQAALSVWQEGDYACILSDCNMPLMDGYEMSRQIRALEAEGRGHIPIIAITANAGGQEKNKCREAGMDELMSKPLDIKKLELLLDRYIAGSCRLEPKSAVKKPVEPLLPIDMTFLSRLVGDNPDLQKRVLAKFFETTPATLDEVCEAIQQRDDKRLRFVAHRLKSAARSMGGNALGECCQALENVSVDQDWHKASLLYRELRKQWKRLCDAFGSNDDTRQIKHEACESVHADLRDLKVLVLEDDSLIVEQLQLMLQQYQLQHITYSLDGVDGLDQVDRANPAFDIILCDLNLPGMDGIEFLRHLAQRQFNGEVVLMSGEAPRVLNSAGNLATAHNLTILATLHKPVTADSLQEALLRYPSRGKSPMPRSAMPMRPLTGDELKEGLEKGYTEVYFQPKIEVNTWQVIGVEALARWHDPERGVLAPWTFIPVAEEEGLIDELTYAVFEKTMAWGERWREQGIELKLAVNLSMDSLSKLELPEYFVETAARYRIAPSMVTLEVTESQLMDNITAVLEVLTRIRLKGIALSIDDFGTGYSTMEHLKKMPFGEFKIDRSFVNGASKDNEARAILEYSVSLAKKLGMGIVAEGVEEHEDWQLIEALGCDQAQGYFIAKPMPGEQVAAWLAQWQRLHPMENNSKLQ